MPRNSSCQLLMDVSQFLRRAIICRQVGQLGSHTASATAAGQDVRSFQHYSTSALAGRMPWACRPCHPRLLLCMSTGSNSGRCGQLPFPSCCQHLVSCNSAGHMPLGAQSKLLTYPILRKHCLSFCAGLTCMLSFRPPCRCAAPGTALPFAYPCSLCRLHSNRGLHACVWLPQV